MLGVGIVVFLVGYGVTYWGYQVFNQCSASFIDVMWPGKFTPCAPGSSTPGSGGGKAATATSPTAPGQTLPPGMAPILGGHS